MKTTLYLLFVFTFMLPMPAYAYLDPGSGNALVYVLISFFGAFIFSLKSLFYAIVGKSNGKAETTASDTQDSGIVIFSEGKQYWNTFKPIVEALLRKQVAFSYYTMNVNDPCLELDSPYLDNRYIGNGSMAYARLGNLKASVMVATTPNIGTEGYPLPRPKNVKNLLHVFHGLESMPMYHLGSLDHYDTVMLVGNYEVPMLRKLEKIRSTPAKKLVLAGLPYLDELAAKKEREHIENIKNDVTTVLVAPSWDTKGCLAEYGFGFVEDLAKAGFKVIVRPHPQSLRVEKEMVDQLISALSKYPNVSFDYAIDGSRSFAEADVMVSDRSRVRTDFMFLYNKPVITLDVPLGSMDDFEIVHLPDSWLEENLARLGYTLNHETVKDIVAAVTNISNKTTVEDILKFREEALSNWGRVGEVIADYLVQAAQEAQEE
ncbi:MAG: CDP-glycerol glycerophosphotransferase family protein [Phascolarctobacterium sp.]|nr:CDP-glycerol glycerophosphotransferase family protein [Phascolarctobacterium sp.]